MPSIVIVGGGASGTLTAAHLLADRRTGQRDITLVERGPWAHRGVAYRTTSAAHLLNVPAANMSAYPGDPSHFVTWASRRAPGVNEDSFLPRHLFGDYLDCVLAQAEHAASPHARLHRVAGEVTDVVQRAEDAVVLLADGRRFEADAVVLALGNFSPGTPSGIGPELVNDQRYVADPWAPGALERLDPNADVLLIGTGLTAVDVALALDERGQKGRLFALSRHGLTPVPHRERRTHPNTWAPTATTARGLIAEVRAQIRKVECDGGDWRTVIDSLRASTPATWSRMSDEDRSRFVRHASRYWDAHRHRMAPAVADKLARLQSDGQLAISAGRLIACSAGASHLTVQVRRHGLVDTINIGAIVNCTGPRTDVEAIGDPLIDALVARGSLKADGLRLGAETTSAGEVVSRAGIRSQVLWAIGPLRKAASWESTAIPEIRQQAAALARLFGDRAWRPAHKVSEEVSSTNSSI